MNAQEFWKTHRQQVAAVCEEAGTKPSYFTLIRLGHSKCGPDLAARLEKASGGLMSRVELVWPEDQDAAA